MTYIIQVSLSVIIKYIQDDQMVIQNTTYLEIHLDQYNTTHAYFTIFQ